MHVGLHSARQCRQQHQIRADRQPVPEERAKSGRGAGQAGPEEEASPSPRQHDVHEANHDEPLQEVQLRFRLPRPPGVRQLRAKTRQFDP